MNILDTFGGLDDSRTAVSSSGFNCMASQTPPDETSLAPPEKEKKKSARSKTDKEQKER